MSENKNEFDELSMVPERDELRSHGKSRRGTSSTASSASRVTQAQASQSHYRASGSMRFLVSLLFIGMLASAGAGYFFYSQGQLALANLDNAIGRVLQLENRLSLVGEAAEQSSLSLVERVDFNFSEIDKLWAARNRNVVSIDSNTVLIEGQAESITGIEGAITNQAGMLNQNNVRLASIDTQIETVTSNIAGMDDLDQQLTLINADLNRVKTAMSALEQSVNNQVGSTQLDLTNRINTTEQDIESINISRLQINQRLSSIQSSINSLQEQIGQ